MIRRAIAVAFVLVLVLGLGFSAWVTKDIQARGDATGERVRLKVGEGAGFATIVHDLEANGLLARPWTLQRSISP